MQDTSHQRDVSMGAILADGVSLCRRETPPSKTSFFPPPLFGEASRFADNDLGSPIRGRLSPAGRDVAKGDREGGGAGTAQSAVTERL